MSRLIFCVFLLCSKMLFSQIETKEAFLNQVYKDFIPENYHFFYLKEPFIPKTPSCDFLLGELTLSQIDDYKKIIHAIEKRKKDSIIPSWNFQMLEKKQENALKIVYYLFLLLLIILFILEKK